MDKLIFTITDAGRQEIINASNTGTEKVEIKSVGIGNIYYLTSPDQTEIGGEIKRITGIGGAVISADTIHVSAKDDSNDEYVVHTVGLYTDKGTLFAVYSRKEPIINKSASTVMLISSDITFKSLDTANITFGDVVFINPPASESVVGVSRFATAEEVEEGLDPAIAVSAKRLKGELDKKANLDSPNLTGTPTAPTAAESDNSQKIATTAFIKQVLLAYAKLASPNFTGKPTAPTADHSSNDTQIATTAFVRAAIAALVDSSPGALDTLNELAAAIGNDPNFATTMINALAGKQPLDGTLTNLSGKDVPALLQYLGLVETINRAAGAVQKSGDTMSGELKIPGTHALRIFNEQFGLIFRRSEDSLHLIPTLENQGENGDIGPLRPLSINLRTGDISISHKLSVGDGALIHGALGIGVESALGGNSIALGDGDTGFKQNGDGVLDAYSNSRQVMRIVPSGVQVFGSTGSWIYMREQTCFSSVAPVDKDGASAIVRQEHPDRHFILGGLGNHQFGIYMINKSRSVNGTDGQAFMNSDGDWVSGGRILPGNYENFDGRYQPRGNYATQEWVLQNFVQNIRVSAPQERKFWDGASWSSNDSAFATAIWMVGGSSNVGGLLVRYIQKLINGTWYNVIE